MIVPAQWTRHLTEHLPTARAGRDPEGVHQVRVAAGHLDVWLRLARWRVLRDDVRWLRRRASAVRDLDVLLADEPPAEWRPWLRRRRAEERRRLLEALDAPRLQALLHGLALLPPLEEDRARRGVSKLARRALRKAERLEQEPESLDRLHALRRAFRRLRYGLEWTGEGVEDLKRLQDAFGDLNDLVVAKRLVASYSRPARLATWTKALERRLATARERALAVWAEERDRVASRAG